MWNYERRRLSVALRLLGAVLLVPVTGFAPGSQTALAAEGDLDSAFGTGGKVVTDFGGTDQINAVAIQADGKIVAVGNVGGSTDFGLARYNSSGGLDSTFGVGGKSTTDFGGTDVPTGAAIQSDGRIVVAGLTDAGGDFKFAVARYDSSGMLDPSFGVGGKVTTDFGPGSFDVGLAVAIQADGKIVVSGQANGGGAGNMALVRYDLSGNLDAAFGSGGKVTTDFGADEVAYSVAIQADGRIVAAGQSGGGGTADFAAARYDTSGNLDLTFGSGGKVTTNFGGLDTARDVVIQGDGKIVVAGNSNGSGTADFALARYNSLGILDGTFGIGGRVMTDFGGSELGVSIAVQPDGKLVLVGDADLGSGIDFLVARYNSSGSLDNSFGLGGKVTTDFAGSDYPAALVIQSDGKIVVGGTSSSDFVLARYQGSTSTPTPTPVPVTGQFVIGDLTPHTAGSTVTFWGSQWHKKNKLSGEPPPASFKGFEDSTQAANCGGSWTSRPGNSADPPSAVPQTMAVIVSSNVTKSGATISGDVKAIVLVQVDPGYGPSPGQAGTGTVVGVICSSP